MGIEIERKFLIRDDRWRQQVERSTRMRQGYLTSDARCSVRLRVAGSQGFLNIKSGTLGIQRSEYEYAIPLTEAEEILDTLSRQRKFSIPCVKSRCWRKPVILCITASMFGKSTSSPEKTRA